MGRDDTNTHRHWCNKTEGQLAGSTRLTTGEQSSNVCERQRPPSAECPGRSTVTTTFLKKCRVFGHFTLNGWDRASDLLNSFATFVSHDTRCGQLPVRRCDLTCKRRDVRDGIFGLGGKFLDAGIYGSNAGVDNIWVSPTQFPSRTCSVACLTARLALCMCGTMRCATNMCMFDTWHSLGCEFTSSSCSPWAFTSSLGLHFALVPPASSSPS